jgi:HAD superfamily hydrolase (TIGR01549 family)
MPPVQTAVFDLDGTLGNTLPLIYRAFNAALEPEYGRRLSDSEIRKMFGPPDNYILRRLLPGEAGDAAFARYRDVYLRDHAELAHAFEGIQDLIARAKAEGVRIGVVTGKSRETALYSLKEFGLLDAIEVLYAGDDVERQKPDPEAVIKILNDLGHKPGDTGAFIGDSAADVLAGRAAGLRTIAVSWGSPDQEELRAAKPDVIVDSMDELAAALGL